MLKLENSIRGLSFSRVAFDLTIQDSKIACRKDNTNFGIDTDCWFNHKDLGLLLDHLEIIGVVELYPCKLWKLAPAGTLEDIYEEITDEPRTGRLRLIDTNELVKDIVHQ